MGFLRDPSDAWRQCPTKPTAFFPALRKRAQLACAPYTVGSVLAAAYFAAKPRHAVCKIPSLYRCKRLQRGVKSCIADETPLLQADFLVKFCGVFETVFFTYIMF